MKNLYLFGLATAGLFAVMPAQAQAPHYPRNPPPGYYYPAPGYSPWAPGAYGPSAQQWTQYEYDRSGTLGRQGLGADPRHPEGPGNAVSPR